MGKVVNLTNSLKTEEVFVKVGELAPIKINDGRSVIMKAMKLIDEDAQDEGTINKVLGLLLGKTALADIEKELGELSFNGYQELLRSVISLATGQEIADTSKEFPG